MKATMKRIHALAAAGRLPVAFRAKLLDQLLGIDWAGNFLPKHCEGTNGPFTVHFVRVARGLYSLKKSK